MIFDEFERKVFFYLPIPDLIFKEEGLTIFTENKHPWMLWFKWVSYESAVSPWIEIFTQECIKCCADGMMAGNI